MHGVEGDASKNGLHLPLLSFYVNLFSVYVIFFRLLYQTRAWKSRAVYAPIRLTQTESTWWSKNVEKRTLE
jgi:hypothetical protein